MQVKLIVKYFERDDLPDLNEWRRARDLSAYEIDELPAVGFMVSDGDLKIATCFLRRCEGCYGIVDGLCSNPEAASGLRHAALDVAIRMVGEEARQRDITHLVAWTVDGGVLERSCGSHGYIRTKHALLVKDIKEETITHQ